MLLKTDYTKILKSAQKFSGLLNKIFAISVIIAIVFAVSITSVSAQSQYDIPPWIKNVAGLWAKEKITDTDFGGGITYLIDKEIIKIPKITELQDQITLLKSENKNFTDNKITLENKTKVPTKPSSPAQYKIPAWIKNLAGYWADEKITDEDFGKGITYLIDKEIIKVPKIIQLQDQIRQLKPESDTVDKITLENKTNIISPTPTSCPSGKTLVNGVCTTTIQPTSCPSGKTLVNGVCTTTIQPTSCPSGKTLVNGVCVINQNSTSTPIQNNEFKEFKNSDSDSVFSIKYPTNWIVKQKMSNRIDTYPQRPHYVSFSDRELTDNLVNTGQYNGIDIFKIISVENVFYDKNEALDWIVFEKQDICTLAHQETGYPDLAYTCSDFKVLNSTQIKIGDKTAYEISYSEVRTPIDGSTKFTRTAWEIVMPFQASGTLNAWDFEFGSFEDVTKYKKMLKESVYSFRIS